MDLPPGSRTAGCSAKESQKPATQQVHLLSFTFPDYQHFPSQATKLLNAPPIPFYISTQLQSPIADSRLRSPSVFASLVMMPKTTVNEDDFSPCWEHQVGRTRQVSLMKGVTVSKVMQKSAHNEFRLGVLTSNPAHDLTAACWRDSVHRIAYEVSRYNLAIGGPGSTSKWQSTEKQER